MTVSGGELVGLQAPRGFNPACFDPSKFAAFPESQNRRRKAAIERNLQRYEKRRANQIGAGEFLQLNSNVPLRGIALGAAAWAGGVYAYAPDYSALASGDPILTNLTPRIGAGVLTPTNSSGSSANNPVYRANGIGGRPDFDCSINNSCFNLNWIAASFSGVSMPMSVVFRGIRTQNESGCAFGVGTTSSTLRYMETAHTAAGNSQVNRNDGTTTASSGTTTQNEGFVAIVVGMTFTGSAVSIYHNGVITSISNVALVAALTTTFTQARWGSTGRSTAGTDDYAGALQFLGVSHLQLTAAQHLEVNDFLVAQDVPPSVGTQFVWAGDSIPRASGSGGVRKYFWEWYTDPAQDYSLDAVGPVATGSFPDNQCNCFSGMTISQLTSNLTHLLGSSGAYPNVHAINLWIGSNDCVSGYSGPTAASDYATLLSTTDTLLQSSTPGARMIVFNVTAKDGPNDAYVNDFNTRLFGPGGVCDTWDAAHPTRPVIRVYANQAMGPWNAAYYIDAVHPNYVGYGRIANDPTYGFIACAGAYYGTI